jgi:hypothetical protein
MTDPMGTIPLFPAPEPERLKAAKTLAQRATAANPSWLRHKGRRLACDECVTFLHENNGAGPHPRSVRWVRTVAATKDRLRLCEGHAEPRRKTDAEAAEARKRKGQS